MSNRPVSNVVGTAVGLIGVGTLAGWVARQMASDEAKRACEDESTGPIPNLDLDPDRPLSYPPPGNCESIFVFPPDDFTMWAALGAVVLVVCLALLVANVVDDFLDWFGRRNTTQ